MKVHVSDSTFKFSHGKAPKGFGRWGFTFGDGNDENDVFWFTGNFGDAKKAAVKEAKNRKSDVVKVCP